MESCPSFREAPVWLVPDGPGPVEVLVVEDLAQQRLPARQMLAVLERAGIQACIANLSGPADISPVADLARKLKPRLIVCSLLFADRLSDFRLLFDTLSTENHPAHRALVGPLPSLAPYELLQAWPSLDSVLVGEPETRIVELALAVGGEGPARIPGLAARLDSKAESGSFAAEKAPLAVSDLDSLPFPSHEDGIPSRLGYGFATVKASRGCYHGCTLCLPSTFHHRFGPCYRQRSPENTLAEIEELYEQGANLFLFDDEQFLPPSAREEYIEQLGSGLERRGLRIGFTCKCRADDVEKPLFQRLQGLGLLRVYVGIESGCRSTLRLLGKGTDARVNLDALRCFSDLGIVADWSCLAFHPRATMGTLREDLEFLSSALPYSSTLFSLRDVEIYARTPLAGLVGEQCLRDGNRLVLRYRCADPKAEVVRRIAALLFGQQGMHGRLERRLTESWFDQLLLERFQLDSGDSEGRKRLPGVAGAANRAVVRLLAQILNWAETADLDDVEEVNGRASAWALEFNEEMVGLLEQLPSLERQYY